MLDWFGLHPDLRWISPAYLPGGLSDLEGNTLYAPGWHFGFNWPAFIIVMILTVILVRGIRESAETNNVMVLLKIVAILVFIGFASRFIHPANWHPFAPNGWPGVLTGGSIVFFTYIGFDSVSTAAEECKNPQRDVPIGIIATLIICTLLYIGVVVVLTGLVPWQTLVDDAAPVVNTLKKLHFTGVRLVVLLGALMGMISSLLVFQLGQARVWFAMSRDGLLPRIFSRVHPRYCTPDFSTWMAGFVVGIPAGLLDIGTLADLSNIGTLFAFALVAGGVLILRYREPNRKRAFRAPGWPAGPDRHDLDLSSADGGSADHQLDSILRVDGHRSRVLLQLRPQDAARCAPRIRRRGICNGGGLSKLSHRDPQSLLLCCLAALRRSSPRRAVRVGRERPEDRRQQGDRHPAARRRGLSSTPTAPFSSCT